MALHRLIHRGREFQYFGKKLNLSLSLGLFSSNDIDAGSRQLLRSLAKEAELANPKSILDVGCGTGILAMAMQSRFPESQVEALDRDALACRFTKHNSQVNGLGKIAVKTGLFLDEVEHSNYDLIMSNIPAKAGEPVISHFLQRAGKLCSSQGFVAVVVVEPLREVVERNLTDKNILYQEHNKMYSIFHYRDPKEQSESVPPKGLNLYIRNSQDYQLEKANYHLDTVYNLPDFDQISWKDQLAAESMKAVNRSGNWLIINPGQGHYVQWLVSKKKPAPKKIILASRDYLSLLIVKHNLVKLGYSGEIQTLPMAIEEDLPELLENETIDYCHVDLQPVTRSQWEPELWKTLSSIVVSKGFISLIGKSRDIQSIEKFRKASVIQVDHKSKGNRSVVLRMN